MIGGEKSGGRSASSGLGRPRLSRARPPTPRHAGLQAADRHTAEYGLAALQKRGAEKAQCVLTSSQKWELNVEAGEMTLLRTTFNSGLHFKAIKESRQGMASSNKTDRNTIDKTADEVLEIAGASQPDEAYDIADKQNPESFCSGPEKPDLELMYDRLQEFLHMVKQEFPRTILEQVVLDFTLSTSCFLNSNDVSFETTKGLYGFSALFTSKEGKKTSSFNYSGATTKDLDRDLMRYGSVHELMRQSDEQVDLKRLEGKFVGDLIITPDCLADFIGYFTGSFLSDHSLISGTSILKDKLNEKVTDSRFTLHSRPLSDEIADNYFVTGDGFKAQNSTVVEGGVLKTFLLSLYGSRKTGKERAVNSGGAYVVEPGDLTLDEVVGSVERGILLCRFSGGRPSENGDFSGVAKNSYYIENGSIRYPVDETMVSGNLSELFRNIRAISKERINFGSAIYPWLMASGLTVSGK